MTRMTQIVKRSVAALLPASQAEGLRILLYHAVDAPTAEDLLSLRVSPEAFCQQMTWLRDEGYSVVSLSAVGQGWQGPSGRGAVAITFDDGFRSQETAAHVLETLKFPATFFVVPQFLDGTEGATGYWRGWGYLDWQDVKRLAARGFDIGAHSVSHAILTHCTPETLRDEVSGARTQLTERLGRPIHSFSYPHGRFDVRVQAAVRDAGYAMACTSQYGVNQPPWSWWALRRIEIIGGDRLDDFRRKVEGRYDWVGTVQQWRAADA